MNSTEAGLLRIEGVCKNFNDLEVLKNINLTLVSQSSFCLLGPNGAGKTTLLKILAGILIPDSGFIFLRGEKVHSGNYRKTIGYCPQTPIFWKNLNCEEQLLFTSDLYGINRKKAQSRADYLLERLGLAKNTKTIVQRLSGGMQKRLNFALSLVHEPDILILDEPTANLDMESKELVRSMIRDLATNKNTSILYTTHDLEDTNSMASEVGIISKGNLIFQTKLNERSQSESFQKQIKELYLLHTNGIES